MLIPVLAWAAIIGGGGVLWWYADLSQSEKTRADRLAMKYASEVFGKAVNQLTAGEARQVHSLVQRHLNN